MMYQIVFIAEGLAVLLGTWYFYKFKNTSFKFLLAYLWIMLAMENANHLFDIPDFWQFVRWNLFGIASRLLFMWMFREEIHSTRRKKIIGFLMMLLTAGFIISLLLQGFAAMHTTIQFTANIFGIISIALYAADLFSREYIHEIGRDIVVWIAATFLIIFTSFPIIQTAKLLFYGREPLFSNIRWIMTGVIILMYSVLCFGFIYSYPKK